MTAGSVRPRSGGIVLTLLLLAYILNFLDRQILGILAQPIKADLELSDAQFGAIGGLAFALLYSVLGVPLLWKPWSRFSRKTSLTSGLPRRSIWL